MKSRHENPNWSVEMNARETKALGDLDVAQLIAEKIIGSAEADLNRVRKIREVIVGDSDCALTRGMAERISCFAAVERRVTVFISSIDNVRKGAIEELDLYLSASESDQRSYRENLPKPKESQKPSPNTERGGR